MIPSRWLSYLRENSLSDERLEPVLLRDMSEVARNCCQEQASPLDWLNLARHQRAQLRSAYLYLKGLERALPPCHPGRANCRTLRSLLLAIRESLREVQELLPLRQKVIIERELESQRKAFLGLGKEVARLDDALKSVFCEACENWHPATMVTCPECQGDLERYDFSRDDRPDDQQMAPEYVLLRQLADQVHRDPEAGQPLREHALEIAELLKATIEPTRQLAQAQPDAPVEEMVDYLRTARAALLEMAEWPKHRDPKRLERGWLLMRDQLGRFEQGLEDYGPD